MLFECGSSAFDLIFFEDAETTGIRDVNWTPELKAVKPLAFHIF